MTSRFLFVKTSRDDIITLESLTPFCFEKTSARKMITSEFSVVLVGSWVESGKTCKNIDNRCLFYCIYRGWMPLEMTSYSKNFLYNNNICASLF